VALVVLAVVWLLVLPLLNTQREKRNRAVCARNLAMIGAAIRAYQSDHHGLIPNAGLWHRPHQDDPSWDLKLINGGYAAPPVFHCPSDRIQRATALCDWHPMPPNVGLRSYAINMGSNGAPETFWIQGSRLPCPHLPNPDEVVLVSEMLDDALKGRIGAKCSSLAFHSPAQITSFHVKKPHPLARDPRTNYLFLDGHVAWVDAPRWEMFPPPPGAGFASRPCP